MPAKHQHKVGAVVPHLVHKPRVKVTITGLNPDGSYSVKEFCGKIPAEHLETPSAPEVEKTSPAKGDK